MMVTKMTLHTPGQCSVMDWAGDLFKYYMCNTCVKIVFDLLDLNDLIV